MTQRLHVAARVATLCATLLAACSANDSTTPITDGSAALAAKTFADLADSVQRAGGDPDLGGSYLAIAGILRAGGRVTPITVTIDGAPANFIAAAMSAETITNACPPGAECIVPEIGITERTLIAWDRANPKRIVQLVSSSNDEPIAAVLYPTLLAIYAPSASLTYMDGAGGTYFGTSGTQRFGVEASTTPCPAPSDSTPLGVLRPKGYLGSSCVLADISVAFDAKAEPSPFLVDGNTATGEHTISMASQTVAGTHVKTSLQGCDTSCVVPGGPNSPPTPPVVVQPSDQLPASLAASVGAAVTLQFTVRNPSADSATTVTYPSGQKYDFIATDSTTGRDVWRWSANKSFTAAVQTETIPAGGSLTFTESWTPPSRGKYLVHATLVSTSHRAEAYAAVVVP